MHLPYIWNDNRKPSSYVDLATYLMERRTIFIGPEISTEAATVVCMQLLALAQEEAPISLYINCYGGSVPAGLAILDMVNSVNRDVPVHTYCVGECVGIATAILVSGRVGKRRAFPSARISLFQEWYGVESLWGAQSQDDNEHNRLMGVVRAALQHNTRLDKIEEASLNNRFRELSFFDVNEALLYGIIDEVCGSPVASRDLDNTPLPHTPAADEVTHEQSDDQ